jgi:hypothetical protein
VEYAFRSLQKMKQPTVREINAHVFAGTGNCYVYRAGKPTLRIGRARTRKGVVEGRVIVGSSNEWEPIPPDAVVELGH